ncbi:dihydrolipoyl dehydrogenase [Castellaniella sp.]|uniref:dihydrolipoyl dehydrogenase n=1 Tax=Castellaniella sp. TaxID=1955812 RepID=UPI003560152E
MPKERVVDVAIVGAGSAGLSAYREVVKAGLRPLLIEAGAHGTMCARVGCMPSKLLIAAAQAAADARHASQFGLRVGPVHVDGPAVMQRVRRERDRFVGFVLADVQAMPAGHRLDARVQFVAPGLLRADDGQIVRAQRIILATGTEPVIPDSLKPLGKQALVNDDVFEWHDLPRSVLVVGAGVIGVELGQALARLGVRVRTLTRSDNFARVQDALIQDAAVACLAPDLGLVRRARIMQVRCSGPQVEVTWAAPEGPPTTERFDRVLATTGRHHTLAALALERAGIEVDADGHPDLDPDTLQIRGHPVFLAGDATGRHAIQHEASDDGHKAGRNAAAWPDLPARSHRASLEVVFSDPQIMRVGLGGQAFDPERMVIGQADYSRQGRSRVMLRNQGLLHVYMRRSDRRFLGAEMVGPDAEHVAHLLAWALQMELSVPDMLALPFYHPTIEEGVRTALRGAVSAARAGR